MDTVLGWAFIALVVAVAVPLTLIIVVWPWAMLLMVWSMFREDFPEAHARVMRWVPRGRQHGA